MIPALKIKNLKLKEVESFGQGLAFLSLEAWLVSSCLPCDAAERGPVPSQALAALSQEDSLHRSGALKLQFPFSFAY